MKRKTKPDYFKNAARVHLDYSINRYLMANAEGRWDGTEKAKQHTEMCLFYVAIKYGIPETNSMHSIHYTDFDLAHEATRALTSHLDTAIGFPLKGGPDYEKLVPLFFERFHELATKALGIEL